MRLRSPLAPRGRRGVPAFHDEGQFAAGRQHEAGLHPLALAPPPTAGTAAPGRGSVRTRRRRGGSARPRSRPCPAEPTSRPERPAASTPTGHGCSRPVSRAVRCLGPDSLTSAGDPPSSPPSPACPGPPPSAPPPIRSSPGRRISSPLHRAGRPSRTTARTRAARNPAGLSAGSASCTVSDPPSSRIIASTVSTPSRSSTARSRRPMARPAASIEPPAGGEPGGELHPLGFRRLLRHRLHGDPRQRDDDRHEHRRRRAGNPGRGTAQGAGHGRRRRAAAPDPERRGRRGAARRRRVSPSRRSAAGAARVRQQRQPAPARPAGMPRAAAGSRAPPPRSARARGRRRSRRDRAAGRRPRWSRWPRRWPAPCAAGPPAPRSRRRRRARAGVAPASYTTTLLSTSSPTARASPKIVIRFSDWPTRYSIARRRQQAHRHRHRDHGHRPPAPQEEKQHRQRDAEARGPQARETGDLVFHEIRGVEARSPSPGPAAAIPPEAGPLGPGAAVRAGPGWPPSSWR